MNITIEFNLVTSADPQAVLQAACQLAEANYHARRMIYIYADSERNMQVLDELLWSFRDDSFVPHQAWLGSSPLSAGVVLLGHIDSPAPPAADVLINLTATVPDFYTQFQQVVEIISNEPTARQMGRERFKYYKAQGCELITKNT